MPTANLDWKKIALANTHPLQIAILEIFKRSERPLSPKDLAEELGRDLGVVSYHVRTLRNAKLIKQKSKKQVRGAVQTFYVAGDI